MDNSRFSSAMPLGLANPSKCSTRAADGASEVKTLWFARRSREYSAEIQAILQKLEVIPTLKTGDAESIDVPAVIRRHPQVALIDGLAYENPPGSPNAHRWQDVEQLLEAGISVITTVNLQYLEKLRDEVERITGKRAPCSIPRGFLDRQCGRNRCRGRSCDRKPFAWGRRPRIALRCSQNNISSPGCANWLYWSRLA